MDKTDEYGSVEAQEFETTPSEEQEELTWTGQEATKEAEGEPYAEPNPENYDSVPAQESETNPTEEYGEETNPTEEYGEETTVIADQEVAEEGEGEPFIEPDAEPAKYAPEEPAGETEETTAEEPYALEETGSEQETPLKGTEYDTTAVEEEGYPTEEAASGEETYKVPSEEY